MINIKTEIQCQNSNLNDGAIYAGHISALHLLIEWEPKDAIYNQKQTRTKDIQHLLDVIHHQMTIIF